MADRFAPRLINGPFEDPGVFVSFHYESRALLFDLGSLQRLGVKEILKLSDVFVSHTHIDHFIGFDYLLRRSLNRERPLRLFGPRGIIDNVRGKLRGYTWNLIRDYPVVLVVHEVDQGTLKRVVFQAAHDFQPEEDEAIPFSGTLIEEPALRVRSEILDHGIPCLAYSLEESNRFNIKGDVLETMDLDPGPWLDELKRLLRLEKPGTSTLEAPMRSGGTSVLTVKEWRDRLVVERPGQKIVYVVDARYDPANIRKILSLARGADVFFCEAAFSEADAEKARQRSHLTATQAANMARQAEVKRFVPFHFSLRYESEPNRLQEEADRIFNTGR